MIWLMTWQWKLYKLTHCGLNNLVGMRNIHHRAMHDLKTYFAALTSHSSSRVLVLALTGFTTAIRARLFSSPAPLFVYNELFPL